MRHIVIAPSLRQAQVHATRHNLPTRTGDLFSIRRGARSIRGMEAEGLVIHAVRPDLWPPRIHRELAPLLALGARYA